MSNYCDSKILERTWTMWIVSKNTPCLDEYRKRGVLWTRIYASDDPKAAQLITTISSGKFILHHLVCSNNEFVPFTTEDSVLQNSVAPELCSVNSCPEPGYLLDIPTDESWKKLLLDISKMCTGISTKFTMSADAQNDLASDALLQVIRKLQTGKLTFTPGRAPVFNLLTTTIHRCMFSIISRIKSQKNNVEKLYEQLKSNTNYSQRSLRIASISSMANSTHR